MKPLPLFALIFISACSTMSTSVAPEAESKGPQCKMQSNGRQVCGYHCRMGSDGNVACANTPDGVCAMGADGRVVCSQAASNTAPPPSSAGVAAPTAAACHSSIDCGAGKFCEDRGDGLKLCMGNERRGAFCHASTDCAGGLFCKPRGDGFQVCM